MSNALPPIDPLRRYRVTTACEYLGISRAHFYKKLQRGEIEVIRDGARVFVAGSDLVARPQR